MQCLFWKSFLLNENSGGKMDDDGSEAKEKNS